MKKSSARLFGNLQVPTNDDDYSSNVKDLNFPDWSSMTVEEIYQIRRESKTLESFGFKTSWYAISEKELASKQSTNQDLAHQLNLEQQEHVSWNEGFIWKSENYDDFSSCFITPNLRGWIYVVCSANDELELLNDKFDNYLAFSSHRVINGVAWKIVQQGQVQRYFSYADGRIYHNLGAQTHAEKQLNLPNISGLDGDAAIEEMYQKSQRNNEEHNHANMTDEEIPAKMNELLTSQNPLNFNDISIDEVTGKGIVGFLPN